MKSFPLFRDSWLSSLAFSLLAPRAVAQDIKTSTKVHRLTSKQRAPFDAFLYVNRIPEAAEEGEAPTDYTGRVYGRLANQEGSILLKLPSVMDRKAYLGFKTFWARKGMRR
ncbi:MAG: hypothetical protein M2R45_05136 [Verrucomicrobia subdivision 3 bacterium]|nr:hypothetical protein [Limisphaerales bacterium]MCS1417198.1 hypothetical protein [Limisphaerales bacterium]